MTHAELVGLEQRFEALAGHQVNFRYRGEVRHLLLDPVEPVRHGATGPYLIGRGLRTGGRFAPAEPRSFRLDEISLDQ
jgi:hypothetical protein